MSDTVIKVENVSKLYRLGEISSGTITHDLSRWLARIRGKEDPFAKIGESNDRTSKGNSDYVWALKDVDFEVKKGEVLGIIGRNGAGKSTLLKILSKTTAPTTGAVKIKGRIASLLEVGTGFHPELSGRDNIFLNGAILGMTKREIKSKFDEIVDFAGIERYVDTPVKRYSSGMYVRLAFAVAAHLEPEILIVDEVLAVGDAEFQKKCLGKMKDVSVNDGRTVLFVSHNMAAISALCNKGLLMQHGTVQAFGNIEPVIQQYLSYAKVESDGFIVFDGTEKERFGEKQYAKWHSINLLDKDSITTDLFAMGEKMIIKLELDVFRTSDDFEIGIAVGNFHDISVHYLIGGWEGVSSINEKGKRTITVEIPQVLMFPGKYLLHIWICIQGAYYDDAIHNAIGFEVEEGKVNEHDTYFNRFSKNTQVYTPSKWTIK